jgi:hypothetical protein
MVGPMAAASQALEATGAAILQKQPLSLVGEQLKAAGEQLEYLSKCIEEISSSTLLPEPIEDGIVSSQRMKYASEKMIEAGTELKGEPKPKPQGKSWLKG